MEFYENNEIDDESYNSDAGDDTSESDFDLNYDKLVDDLDERELSDEDLNIYEEELNYISDDGFTSISLKE